MRHTVEETTAKRLLGDKKCEKLMEELKLDREKPEHWEYLVRMGQWT